MRTPIMHSAAALVLAVAASVAHAGITLPAQFSSNMVIQQKKPVRLWGAAAPGEAIKVTLAGRSAETRADESGAFRVDLPPLDAKADPGPHTLVVSGSNTITLNNILVGEVWLCSGQSNMRLTVKECANADAEINSANHEQIRLLHVPDASTDSPQFSFKGKWSICSPQTVGKFSAAAYYFGRALHQKLGVPVGLIDSARGWSPAEAWVPLDVLSSHPMTRPLVDQHRALAAKKNLDEQDREFNADLNAWKDEQAKAKAAAAGQAPSTQPTQPTRPRPRRAWGVDPRLRPGALYNAMLYPLAPMSLAGVAWYQGESNTDRAFQYRTLLPMLIRHWRTVFEAPELPFGIVQLPQHVNRDKPVDGTWAELREAQWLTYRSLPKTGLIVTTDIGEPFNIHPLNKQDIGKRLAGWALSAVYGEKGIPSSPMFKRAMFEGSRVRVEFDGQFESLVTKRGEPTEFMLAGEDRTFYKTDARIQGKSVIVTSRDVANPKAVRFGYVDSPEVNLFSNDGLPVSPFRSDDWPGLTDGVKTVEWQ